VADVQIEQEIARQLLGQVGFIAEQALSAGGVALSAGCPPPWLWRKIPILA
jgi:hypothetical protein